MIAHVITNFENRGGAEGLLIRHLCTLKNTDLILISLMKISANMASQIPETVKLVELDSKNALTMFLSVFKLSKVLKENGVSNLVCWMYHANIVGSLSKLFDHKTNIIWNVRHSLDDFAGEKFSTKLAIKLGRFLSWRANRIVFCATRSLDQHILIKYCDSRKCIHIPNGFIFNYQYENKHNAIRDKKVVIGATGRFHPSKDYLTLFKALRLAQDSGFLFELRLAGQDMNVLNDNLVALIKEAGLLLKHVTFFGFQEDVMKFYKEIDVFISASKTEGFPNVLVEAASCGCLCIASNAGDSALILSNERRIFPIRDYKKLAETLSYYLSCDEIEWSSDIDKDIEHIVDSFSIDKFNKSLVACYV